MNFYKKTISLFFLLTITVFVACANVNSGAQDIHEKLDVREFILKHVSDSYDWHITNIGEHEISIPLPIIVHSSTGWHIFLSSAFHQSTEVEGLSIAKTGKYKEKIIEINRKGEEVRPLDISITKVSLSLIFSSILLIIIIMLVAHSYKKEVYESKKGFIGFMEIIIININDDVIKPCVGAQYRKYAPYLLTLFFFILINNIMGLIPIFPGGANVTGNIAITFVLAVVTLLIVNIWGSKEYWKEILWPDVPLWLKAPFPLMPIIELVGVFSKAFALMIRLFANMLAGHSVALGLVCLVFVTVSMGPIMNSSMTVVSVIFSIFIAFVELLVAYIQAYIFTMLTAVFIGLARVEPHKQK